MSNSDTAPSAELAAVPIVVQPHAITFRGSTEGDGFEREITMVECLREADLVPALLFAHALILSDMAKALRSMDATIKASASSAGAHKESAQETLDATLARVVGFMSAVPGVPQTVVEQMTNALRPPPGGGTPA